MDFDDRGISRRRFVRQVSLGAGALGVGLYLPGSLHPGPGPIGERARDPQEVLVLGAGLAGLAAAWELDEVGHDVTVLEARTHPGGRVRTLRDPFAGDLYAEAGAAAFYRTYTHADRYIDELGLERVDVPVPYAALYHLRGRRFTVRGDEQAVWPYELSDDERGLGPGGLMQRYLFETLPDEIDEPDAWGDPPLWDLDELSLAKYLREQGASAGAVELIGDMYANFGSLDRTSMLSASLADVALIFRGGAPFVLEGGNDRLPAAMAQRLGPRVRYGVEVTRVRDTGAGVEITAERRGRTESREADRAVCAVPLGVLREIDVAPAMPQPKQRAIWNMPYVDATRTFVQVRRAIWHDDGTTGAAYTDLPVGTVYRHPAGDIHEAGPDDRAILEGYAKGEDASRQADRPRDEVVREVVGHLEKVHPGIGEHVEGAVVKAWGEDPYALGHTSWPGPGEVTRHLEPLQRPHGRIHFAGEHTSILRGTMEGALRSGIRAAGEVDEAGKRKAA